jgi:protein-serine/threonine kinase
MKPFQSDEFTTSYPALRVINGMGTTVSSLLTTAARENFRLSITAGLSGRPGNSTIRWGVGLQSHPEVQEKDAGKDSMELLIQ